MFRIFNIIIAAACDGAMWYVFMYIKLDCPFTLYLKLFGLRERKKFQMLLIKS